MTTDPKQLVLAAFVELLRLADEGKVGDPSSGICNNIDNMLWNDRTTSTSYGDAWEFFDSHVADVVWPRWSKFSGCSSYPIPGGDDAYWAQRGGEFWKGEQGQLRRELLQFTIEQLSKEQDQ